VMEKIIYKKTASKNSSRLVLKQGIFGGQNIDNLAQLMSRGKS